MVELQFGDHILEADVDKADLQDLLASKANKLSVLILESVKSKLYEEMRDSVRKGDLNNSLSQEGYITCLEHLEDFFKVQIQQALK